ncbi:MAG: phenylalanine--tRNA ligase subunit beta [Leptospiraceae bacterium]|nr:phenylalanine--tRNA ligase subunit beta [Leptospiraceae bacterium]
MKLSLDWLGDFINIDVSQISKIEEIIGLSICELDEIEDYKPFLKTVITVLILESVKKPELGITLCRVTDGKNEFQVVSGDNTVQKGEKVALALPGSSLPEKTIKQTEIKGIMSAGMFVSEKEIGISENHFEVLRLPTNATIGESISTLLGLNDKILTIDNKSITHRPDLWSHFGFARELASQLSIPIRFNPFETDFEFQKDTNVEVIRNQNAHSYFACEIDNVTILPSIIKMKSRLEKCGVRSINNIVDVSNYSMLELGQPTHFFDKDTLEKIKISVDFGKTGEKIQLLDDTTFELSPDVLIIRNLEEPVAIAGVMGGSSTAVSDQTKNLILESAIFKREDIRKSIRKTGIRSEASIRYEKGLEASTAIPVIKRVLNLLVSNGCQNLIAKKVTGYNHNENKKVVIPTTFSFINKKLGKKYGKSNIQNVLERLGFTLKVEGDDLHVTVPNYRHNYDVTVPEDIVEEVGRSIGFGTIPFIPLVSEVNPAPLSKARELERKLKHFFTDTLFFNEVYNYSFASYIDTQFEEKTDQIVSISNTMPEEYKYLRNSVYPSLLKNIYTNIDRFETIKIFEYARTYHKNTSELPEEKRWFGFAIVNPKKTQEQNILEDDFIIARTYMENLLKNLNIHTFKLQNETKEYFHPKCSVEIIENDKILVELGYAHPKYADNYGVKKRVIQGKINFFNLLEIYELNQQKFNFKIPSQFPQDRIDISLLMDKNKGTEEFVQIIKQAQIPEINDMIVSSIYQDKSIGESNKSVTYRIELLTYNQTFSSEKIQEIVDTTLQLAKENGFHLR